MRYRTLASQISAALIFTATGITALADDQREIKTIQLVTPAAEPGSRLYEAQAELERLIDEIESLSRQSIDESATIIRKSLQDLPDTQHFVHRILTGDPNRVALGLVLESDMARNHIDVIRVIDAGPAANADIEDGDRIVGVEGARFVDGEPAMSQLHAALDDLQPGDPITLDLERDDAPLTIMVDTVAHADLPHADNAFAFTFGDGDFTFDPNFDFNLGEDFEIRLGNLDDLEDLPHLPALPALARNLLGHPAWRELELVEVNEQLGEYFGTNDGLLVTQVPDWASATLYSGDVLQTIGDRNAESPSKAFRILSSYDEGEEVTLNIIRARQSQELQLQVPERSEL